MSNVALTKNLSSYYCDKVFQINSVDNSKKNRKLPHQYQSMPKYPVCFLFLCRQISNREHIIEKQGWHSCTKPPKTANINYNDFPKNNHGKKSTQDSEFSLLSSIWGRAIMLYFNSSEDE